MKYKFTLLLTLLTFLSTQVLFSQVEICWNRIDDDGDGQLDCADSDCFDYSFCFECDDRFYQVINNRYLATLDIENQWYKDIFVINGIENINGAAMNPIDGHVYASATTNGAHILVLVGTDGSLGNLGLILPGSEVYFMATIDDAGIMYLSNSNSNILSVDLNQAVLTWTDTGIPYPGGTDFAYHYGDGNLYGIDNDNRLIQTNISSGQVSYFDLYGSINNDDGYYGAVWANLGGELFAANGTSGKIYHIDINTKVATEVMDATANLSSNDGFNCGNAMAPFEVDCSNGIDDDGDGLIDCDDPDCLNSNSCVIEICDNGIDDDGDGFVDCADGECLGISSCVEICSNGIDDNGDGLIDELDPQCNTTGGQAGGLESNRRLGLKIAQRNFTRKKLDNGVGFNPVMTERTIDPNLRTGFDMSIFIPTTAIEETIAEITSPTDLVDITNATEVFSADYKQGERRIATVLLLKTENETYEHSKFICDRLDGAQINNISSMFYNDAQLITAELIQADGRVEYACSFAVYLDDKGAYVENHWLKEMYAQKEKMYNFQIWANDIATLTKLVDATISRVNEYREVVSIETSKPPRVFISHGKLINGKLDLYFVNKNQSESITLEGKQTSTEISEAKETTTTFSLNKSVRDKISFDMADAYDIGFRIRTEHGAMDDLFFADGPWGTDFNENENNLVDYTITNSAELEDKQAYHLRRDVQVRANINSGLNIFRGLGPKFQAQNVDQYKNLTFTAKGNNVVNVVIVKESVVLWENQPRATVNLKEEEHKYTLAKSDFSSQEEIDWTDVKMIVFELNNQEETTKEVDIQIRNLNFNNSEIALVTPDIAKGKILVAPNPFTDRTDYHIIAEVATSYEMKLTDNTGKIIKEENGTLIPGMNSFSLNKTNNMVTGIYFLQIIGGDGKIYNNKIMLTTP